MSSKISRLVNRRSGGRTAVDPSSVLGALSSAVFVLDSEDRFIQANLAAEQFFGTSSASLGGKPLAIFLPSDSPIFLLIAQVRAAGNSASEYDLSIESPRVGSHVVTLDVAALPEEPGVVVVCLQTRSIARKIEQHLTHRHTARSVTAMAAMLAHEVKNPLSGIRGAAQLLEGSVPENDRQLTRLICEEADRIVALVDRMEMFSDNRPIARGAVNIHEVLGHVRRLVESVQGKTVRFVESYDPSLPPVLGNRNLLIQLFLNLVKNAVEASPDEGGEVVLGTRYQQGVRLAVPGSGSRIDLPLTITVQDNGPGIPEDLRARLFEPFVSSKPNGKGLGLALVAKIVDDHGGIIEVDEEGRRTVFRISLPKAT